MVCMDEKISNNLILTEKKNDIMTIYLNRPDKRNALNPEIMTEISNAFLTAASDPEVKVVILAGKGKAFSAGIDLFEFPSMFIENINEKGTNWFRNYLMDLHYSLNKIESLEKPVICAIHGYTIGMGLELALTADFRIASRDTRIGIPEVQLGLIPDVGGTTRLTRMVGIIKAKELIMTGKLISADEAFRINLVNEVAPEGEELNVAEKWAREIIDNCSLTAVGLSKKIIDLSRDMDKNTSLEIEGITQSIIFGDMEKVIEGFQARMEGRKPKF